MRHPVEAAIREAVYSGARLSSDELDALKLSKAERAAVIAVVDECLEVRAEGFQGDANVLADQRARDLIAGLPAHKRDPGYSVPDPLAGVHDPDELAASIRRY